MEDERSFGTRGYKKGRVARAPQAGALAGYLTWPQVALNRHESLTAKKHVSEALEHAQATPWLALCPPWRALASIRWFNVRRSRNPHAGQGRSHERDQTMTLERQFHFGEEQSCEAR